MAEATRSDPERHAVLSLWRGASRGKCRGVDFPDVDLEWNPVELDRQLARAAELWRAWRLRLREKPPEGDGEDNPLAIFRPVTGQTLFRKVSDLPEYDPMRGPMRRWVYRLAEQRINHEGLTRLASERQLERHPPDAPPRTSLNVDEMLRRCLSDAPRGEVWLRLFLESAPPVSAAAVSLWQRRWELARRMGLDDPSVIESPAENVHATAKQLADRVGDRVRELELASPAAWIETAIGHDIPGSWPGRLSPQRMLDYFRDGSLLRSLDLRPPPLPASVGAASFCRSLGLVGGAWLEALAPTDQPFVVAHDPYGLKRHEASGLFSLLALNPRFLIRQLEVAPHAMADVQRRLAQIWLLELASAAFRVQLRPHAQRGESAFREAFSDLGHRDLNLSLPTNVTGALFTLGIEDEQRFSGLLLAARRAEELIEAHDEDWFRNPRAIDQLRSEAHQPPTTHLEPERLVTSLDVVVKRLERLLR